MLEILLIKMLLLFLISLVFGAIGGRRPVL